MNVQGLAEHVYLRYLQRWGKDFLRRRLDWTLDEEGGNPAAPRHLTQALCPCQYAEEILRNKEPRDTRACCPLCNHWLRRRGLDWLKPIIRVWQVSLIYNKLASAPDFSRTSEFISEKNKIVFFKCRYNKCGFK